MAAMASPSAIAKTWLSAEGEASAEREGTGLHEIAARAAHSGVRVPELLARGRLRSAALPRRDRHLRGKSVRVAPTSPRAIG